MKNLLIILTLIFVSSLCNAKIGRTGEEVNPFTNHDKMIAQYEEWIKTKRHKGKKSTLEKYKKKLAFWKKEKVKTLAEKVTPLEDRIKRMTGEVKRIDERSKKALEALHDKLEKFKSVLPKYKDLPEKEAKLKLFIEDTEKKIIAAPKFYAKSKEDLQKNIDEMQKMVDQYYNWSSGLTSKDVQNLYKEKNKSKMGVKSLDLR